MNLNFLHPLLLSTYFLPILIIIGNFATNLYFLIVSTYFIFLFIFKKLYLINDDIIKIILLMLVYCFLISIFKEKFFYLKNLTIFIYLILLVHIFCYLLENNKMSFDLLIKIHLIIIIIVTFDTLFQYYYGKNILGFQTEPNNKIRLTSFFYDKYVVGAFLAKTFVPIMLITYISMKKYNNIFIIIFLIAINLAILLSGERSSLIIFYYSVFLIFLTYKKLRKITLCFFILSILISYFLLQFNSKMNSRYIQETFKNTLHLDKNLSTSYKYNNHYGATFLTSVEIIKTNFIWGNGIRSYRDISCDSLSGPELQKIVKFKSNHYKFICNTHPHNYILELLIDFVLLLFLLFFIFIIKIFIKIYKLSKINIDNYGIAFGIQTVSLFFPLSTHGSLFSSWNSIFFIYHFSVFYAFYKLEKKIVKYS